MTERPSAPWFARGLGKYCFVVLATLIAGDPTSAQKATDTCEAVTETLNVCAKSGATLFGETASGILYLQSAYKGRTFDMTWSIGPIKGGDAAARRAALEAQFAEQGSEGWTNAIAEINGLRFYETARSDLEEEIPTELALSVTINDEAEITFVTTIVEPPEGFDIVEAHRFLLSHLESVQ